MSLLHSWLSNINTDSAKLNHSKHQLLEMMMMLMEFSIITPLKFKEPCVTDWLHVNSVEESVKNLHHVSGSNSSDTWIQLHILSLVLLCLSISDRTAPEIIVSGICLVFWIRYFGWREIAVVVVSYCHVAFQHYNKVTKICPTSTPTWGLVSMGPTRPSVPTCSHLDWGQVVVVRSPLSLSLSPCHPSLSSPGLLSIFLGLVSSRRRRKRREEEDEEEREHQQQDNSKILFNYRSRIRHLPPPPPQEPGNILREIRMPRRGLCGRGKVKGEGIRGERRRGW